MRGGRWVWRMTSPAHFDVCGRAIGGGENRRPCRAAGPTLVLHGGHSQHVCARQPEPMDTPLPRWVVSAQPATAGLWIGRSQWLGGAAGWCRGHGKHKRHLARWRGLKSLRRCCRPYSRQRQVGLPVSNDSSDAGQGFFAQAQPVGLPSS